MDMLLMICLVGLIGWVLYRLVLGSRQRAEVEVQMPITESYTPPQTVTTEAVLEEPWEVPMAAVITEEVVKKSRKVRAKKVPLTEKKAKKKKTTKKKK